MAEAPTTEATSTGICNFCKEEFEKGKMTQHLKSCKQRIAGQKAEKSATSEKTKLFHLLVEGRYLPMYWMHLELPAKLTLLDLDGFLRAIWVECCDHLSEFKIGKRSYTSQMEDMWGFGLGLGGTEDVIEGEVVEEENDEDEEEPGLSELTPAEVQALSPNEVAHLLGDMLREEFEANVVDMPPGEFTEKLLKFMETQLGTALPPHLQSQFRLMAPFLQAGLIAEAEEAELDMNVELGKVLKVGQKFSYLYDFGSTTELTLKVVAGREGIVKEDEDEDDIQIMARNNPPVISCRVCGKPATQVVAGYYDAEDGALCDKCAKKSEYGEDMLLPVVNSPRVGVCGYTGDAYEEDDDWEDEEEYEDEDE
jgi:hypothetical protein